jgi:hypothetical protein
MVLAPPGRAAGSSRDPATLRLVALARRICCGQLFGGLSRTATCARSTRGMQLCGRPRPFGLAWAPCVHSSVLAELPPSPSAVWPEQRLVLGTSHAVVFPHRVVRASLRAPTTRTAEREKGSLLGAEPRRRTRRRAGRPRPRRGFDALASQEDVTLRHADISHTTRVHPFPYVLVGLAEMSALGREERSLTVYGWDGCSNSVRVGESSQTSPSRRTRIRSLIIRTTAKSCVMKRPRLRFRRCSHG